MRQVYANSKWHEGLPTKQGQQYRYMTPAGWAYGFYELPASSDVRITKQKFKLRLTQAERILIRETAKTNATVFDFQDLLDSGSHVDLNDSVLITGINAMEQLGLIAEGRAHEILSAPITDNERYEG